MQDAKVDSVEASRTVVSKNNARVMGNPSYTQSEFEMEHKTVLWKYIQENLHDLE